MQSSLRDIGEDAALFEEKNFVDRAEAIDFIDFHLIQRIEGVLDEDGPEQSLEILKQSAGKIKRQLEDVDTQLFIACREKIGTGVYPGSSFIQMVNTHLGADATDGGRPDAIGYDHLDAFINGVLSDQAMPAATLEPGSEMVFFQKTPARIIFQLLELAQPTQNDVFFDLGSGLGQVAILANLISGVPARGIEYEPAYYNYAKDCALRLNLADVEFVNADARWGDYTDGTIFFMYTPFEGRMLQDMLDVLQGEAQKRRIRIFTYGPCSPAVGRQRWLSCVNGRADDPYKLYEFH